MLSSSSLLQVMEDEVEEDGVGDKRCICNSCEAFSKPTVTSTAGTETNCVLEEEHETEEEEEKEEEEEDAEQTAKELEVYVDVEVDKTEQSGSVESLCPISVEAFTKDVDGSQPNCTHHRTQYSCIDLVFHTTIPNLL